MEITRRGFLKMLVAAPVVAKMSLGDGLIKTALAEPIALQEDIVTSLIRPTSWHLAIIDKKTNAQLFNDYINGDPEAQAARITAHLQRKNSGMLTVWLTPMNGECAVRGQKSYYDFNNMKFS